METFAHDLLKACLWGLSALFFGYPKKKPPCRKEALLFRPFDPHHPATKRIVAVKIKWDSRNTRYRFDLTYLYLQTLLLVGLDFMLNSA